MTSGNTENMMIASQHSTAPHEGWSRVQWAAARAARKSGQWEAFIANPPVRKVQKVCAFDAKCEHSVCCWRCEYCRQMWRKEIDWTKHRRNGVCVQVGVSPGGGATLVSKFGRRSLPGPSTTMITMMARQ
jgi:hypothetical protein